MTYTEAKAHGWARRRCWGNRSFRVDLAHSSSTSVPYRLMGGSGDNFPLSANEISATDWEPWVSEPSAIERASRLQTSAGELLEACEAALALVKDTWPYSHGNERVGDVWGKLETAIAKAKGGKA